MTKLSFKPLKEGKVHFPRRDLHIPDHDAKIRKKTLQKEGESLSTMGISLIFENRMSNLLYQLLIKAPNTTPPLEGPRGEGICAPIVGQALLAKKAKRNLYERTD
ncbi:MAG: hypothetical protein IKH88_09560 [Prevotella sp.]|nr:hypothetical protein [Prevotella sp.]